MRTIEKNSTNYLKVFQLSILWYLRDNRRYLYLAIPFKKKRLLVTSSSMKFPNFKIFIFQETIPKFQETQMTYGVRCTDTLHHLEIVNIS